MTKFFATAILLFFCFTQNVFAQADDISSTKRGSGSVVPGSLGSTIRSSGPSKPDPMLNTAMPDPASSISTSNPNLDQDPMLSTSAGVPPSAISTTTQNKHQDPMLSTKAGVPASAKGTSTDVDPVCRALTKYTPSADLAYQPGVDANGKAVAPADVPGTPQMQMPSKVDFPLTINLAQQLHLDTTKPPFNVLGAGTEAWLGTLSVEGDKVTFNGQPLTDQQQDNLAVVCMKQK